MLVFLLVVEMSILLAVGGLDNAVLMEDVQRELYVNCGEESNCVAISDNRECIYQKSCDFLLSYTVEPMEGAIQFQLLGAKMPNSRNYYMAVGFGKLPSMLNNSVVGCFRFNNKYNTHFSYNGETLENIHKVDQSPLLRKESSDFRIVSDDLDRKFYCSFKLSINFDVMEVSYSLNAIHYFLMFVRGEALSLKRMKYHNPRSAFVTGARLNLMTNDARQTYEPKSSEQMGAIQLHVFGFVFIFIFILPTSSMISRFFKESCIHYRVCNKRLWFIAHMLESLVVILGTTLIIVVMEIYFFPRFRIKTFKAAFHYKLGTAIVVLIYIESVIGVMIGCSNPIGGFRVVFSFLHCIVGNVVYLLGLVEIFFSVWTMPYFLRYCSVNEFLVLLWLFIHAFFYMTLSCLLFQQDKSQARVEQLKWLRMAVMETINVGGNLHVPNHSSETSPTGSNWFSQRTKNQLARTISVNRGYPVHEKTEELQEKEFQMIKRINYNRIITERILGVGSTTDVVKRSNSNKITPESYADKKLKTVVPSPSSHKTEERGQKHIVGASNNPNKDQTTSTTQVYSPFYPPSNFNDKEAGSGNVNANIEEDEDPDFYHEFQTAAYRHHGRRRSSPIGAHRHHSEAEDPEDPEDYLNNFHKRKRNLDEFRAWKQFPLQPESVEFRRTKCVAALLVVFILLSLTMAITLCALLSPDIEYDGCKDTNQFIVLQQWYT